MGVDVHNGRVGKMTTEQYAQAVQEIRQMVIQSRKFLRVPGWQYTKLVAVKKL